MVKWEELLQQHSPIRKVSDRNSRTIPINVHVNVWASMRVSFSKHFINNKIRNWNALFQFISIRQMRLLFIITVNLPSIFYFSFTSGFWRFVVNNFPAFSVFFSLCIACAFATLLQGANMFANRWRVGDVFVFSLFFSFFQHSRYNRQLIFWSKL